MATYPTTGSSPWGPNLKTYIDAYPANDRIANLGQRSNRLLDVSQLTPANDIPANYPQLLTIPTGYANNETVEPSVLYDASAPFLGYEYVLCASPYPLSDVTKENPCLWVSHDGSTWVPVVFTSGIGAATPGYGGTATPVFANGVQGDGTNSDPFIYQGPDGTFYLLWNQFLVATGSGGTGTGSNNWGIKISKASSLAGPWSTPVAVLQSVNPTTRPSCPAIFWDGRGWHMYGVELANTSSTTLLHWTNANADPTTGTWVAQTNPAASLPVGYTTQVWWHLNAYYSGGQHVLVIQDSLAGTSGGGNVWVITSNDSGVTWVVPDTPQLADKANGLYRAAVIFTADGGLDVFIGRIGTVWEMRRSKLANAGRFDPQYGGVNSQGLPVNALAYSAARVPIAPYVFGDMPNRADSAVTPGSADSGQAYTVSTGTVGVSSKQLYSPTAPARAALTTTGCADGVTTGEISVIDAASQYYFITRYVDASNYVRFGSSSGVGYVLQNIIAGSIGTGSLTLGFNPVAGDVVALLHISTTITVFVNGRKVARVSGSNWSANSTASGIGVQFSSTVARLRNLTQRPLVNGN